MDPRLPKTDRLLLQVEGGGWAPLDWSPDDAKLLVGQGISATESHLWIVDAASGARTALTRAEAGRADYQGGVFSRDGHGVYTSTDQGSEFHRLTYVDLASGHHTPLSAGIDWDVDAFWTKPVIIDPTFLDAWDLDQNFSGAWVTWKPKKGTAVDAYVLNLNQARPVAIGRNGVPGGFDITTFGVRAAGDVNGQFLYDHEAMLHRYSDLAQRRREERHGDDRDIY